MAVLLQGWASLAPETLVPRAYPGTRVREVGALSRTGRGSAGCTGCHPSPRPQAEERHGNIEEHLRQLEDQLEEKNQELARVSASLGFGAPLCATRSLPCWSVEEAPRKDPARSRATQGWEEVGGRAGERGPPGRLRMGQANRVEPQAMGGP